MSLMSSTTAIIAMCKYAVYVLENSEGSRMATLRGIVSLDDGYSIHLSSLSNYFTEEEAIGTNNSLIDIGVYKYRMSFSEGWIRLTRAEP